MQKLVVTPIGTCRINTPLRRAQVRYPVKVNAARVYGYTHTATEALQQLRYIAGEKKFDPANIPLIVRPADSDEVEADGDERQEVVSSDLTMVEISSAKRIMSGADAVQINYLYRHFADFFAVPDRVTRFWSLSKKGVRSDLLEWLRQEPSFRLLSPEDRSLLIGLKMHTQDYADISAEMAEIVERVGRDKLVFVTHVNAWTPEGKAIPQRERVIRWVKLAAETMQVRCFDPSDLMHDFGQDRAMEKGGLDLTHYTPSFSDRVYAEFHRHYVAPMMHLRADSEPVDDPSMRQQMLADNLDAMMEHDDFVAASRSLFEALRHEPDALPLIQLRGKVMSRIGDHDRAIADLEPFARSASLSTESKLALAQSQLAGGNAARAIELAEELFGDEYHDAALYELAARAHGLSGNSDLALNMWKQAFRFDRSNLTAALTVLTLLSSSGQEQAIDEWRSEILRDGTLGSRGAFEIGRWALDHRDEALLVKVFESILAQDFHQAEDLLNGVLAAGMLPAASACMRLLSHRDGLNPVETRQRVRIAQHIGDIASERLKDGDLVSAFLLADAASETSTGSNVVRTRRAAASHYRTMIRDRARDGNYAEAVAAFVEAGDMIYASPDAVLVAANALNKLGRSEEALAVAKRLWAIDPANVTYTRLAGRTASVVGDLVTAFRAYDALRRFDDPAARRFDEEVARFFARADRRGFKIAREATLAGDFEAAVAICEAMAGRVDDKVRFEAERHRVDRAMRIQLRKMEKGEVEDEGRDGLLRLLLRLSPGDVVILRRAALEMMRQSRFAEAAGHWAALTALMPDNETALAALERCRILAARQMVSDRGQAGGECVREKRGQEHA